jgi:hypothetical protein
MRPQWKLLAVAAALAGVTILPTPAAAKCQPPPSRGDDGKFYQDGWTRPNAGAVGGVYANILNYSPWVQPGRPQTTDWTMVYQQFSTNHAQLGWWEDAGGARHTYLEWTHDGTYSQHFKDPYATGSYTYYDTEDHPNGSSFVFYTAGSFWESQTAQWAPDSGAAAGEVWTSASQMPGGYNNPETSNDAHIYLGSWQSFSGSKLNDNGAWYGNTITQPYNVAIWDVWCSS